MVAHPATGIAAERTVDQHWVARMVAHPPPGIAAESDTANAGDFLSLTGCGK